MLLQVFYGVVRLEIMSPGSAAGLGFGQVRRITVAGKDHIAGIEVDDGVGVRGYIVQNLVEVPHRGLGWGSLLCSEGPERREHCAVDGSPIVEEDAEDLLH